MPRFKTEDEEAGWWASPAGRAYVKQKSAAARAKRTMTAGSGLVAKLNKKTSVLIAIRLTRGSPPLALPFAPHRTCFQRPARRPGPGKPGGALPSVRRTARAAVTGSARRTHFAKQSQFVRNHLCFQRHTSANMRRRMP
jgi:hypothetical protein